MNRDTFRHDQEEKTGILLVNLGTPDAPDRASVRRYLKEFLWDPRVVEMPRPLWWLALNLVILNTRPGRSAQAYQKIWTDTGSPLLNISRQQETALRQSLHERFGDRVCVELGMRYGTPSIQSALEALREQGVRRVLVLPLYPQYSATTTASIFDEVTDQVRPGVVSLPHGYGHDADGQAIANAQPGVNSNVLTDPTALDPLSGACSLNAIPVDLAATP